MIATAVVQNLLGGDASMSKSRDPKIMSDAAYEILTSESKLTTGNFYIVRNCAYANFHDNRMMRCF